MTRERINNLNDKVFESLHRSLTNPSLPIEKYVLGDDLYDDALSVNRSWGYVDNGRYVAGPLSR